MSKMDKVLAEDKTAIKADLGIKKAIKTKKKSGNTLMMKYTKAGSKAICVDANCPDTNCTDAEGKSKPVEG